MWLFLRKTEFEKTNCIAQNSLIFFSGLGENYFDLGILIGDFT